MQTHKIKGLIEFVEFFLPMINLSIFTNISNKFVQIRILPQNAKCYLIFHQN